MEHNDIDDIAAVLDDIATSLDELKESCPTLNTQTYEQMKLSLEKAASAIDRLADRESPAK
jgi:methyl-accepting chemotaxis protein